MDWSAEQKNLAKKYKKLEDIPEKERKYKCHTCHLIVDSAPCPNCGETHLAITVSYTHLTLPTKRIV